MQPSAVSHFACECLGVALLGFALVGTAETQGPLAAQAVGLGLAAITYVVEPASGAHLNPAVSLGHFICHHLHESSETSPADDATQERTRALVAVVAQILGGLAGAAGAWFAYGDSAASMLAAAADAIAPSDLSTSPAKLVALFVGAFLLVFVHLHTTVGQAGTGFFGLAIGFALVASLVVFSSPLNPAVALGLCLVRGLTGSGSFAETVDVLNLGLACAVPLLAAGLATLTVSPSDSPLTTLGAKLRVEAIGVGALVLALCASSAAHGIQSADGMSESFGAASSSALAPSAAASSALGLDDALLYAALMYATKYISRAEFSPAVSLAHYVAASMSGTPTQQGLQGLLLTCTVQLSAAAAAGGLGAYLFVAPVQVSSAIVTIPFAVGLGLFAFAICLVHLAVTDEQPGNGFFGLAVGFLVYAGILALGDTSTALFSPAVAVGLVMASILGSSAGGMPSPMGLGILLGVPLLASLLAAFVHSTMLSRKGAKRHPALAPLVTECIGTMLILLTFLKARGSVGLLYVAITYFGAHTSGAHFNRERARRPRSASGAKP